MIKGIKIGVPMKKDFRPVVQAGSAHCAVIKPKARDRDDMQRHAVSRAQSCDVTSVRWYLRLNQGHVDHKNEQAIKSVLPLSTNTVDTEPDDNEVEFRSEVR